MAAFGGGDAVPTVRGKLPPSGGGVPVFTGGNKRGQDTKYGFLSPLDSPDLPLRGRIGDVQRNVGYGGSVPCVGQIWGRCYALNLLCVGCRA